MSPKANATAPVAAPKYRAMTGLDYINEETGNNVHVDAGDDVVGMSDTALENELAAGNVCLLNEAGEPLDRNGFVIPIDSLSDPDVYGNQSKPTTLLVVGGETGSNEEVPEPEASKPIPQNRVFKKSAGGVLFRDGLEVNWAEDNTSVVMSPERAQELLDLYPAEFATEAGGYAVLEEPEVNVDEGNSEPTDDTTTDETSEVQ